MSDNRRQTKNTRKNELLHRREFLGFTSTHPPRPETEHEYKRVGNTFYVRHRHLDAELSVVLGVLVAEAKIDKRWGRLSVQLTVLRQFMRCSTHITFK